MSNYLTYTSPSNASIFDICVACYGSINRISNIIKDNNIEDINFITRLSQDFIYDYDLIDNFYVVNTIISENIQFATADIHLGVGFYEDYLLAESTEVIDDELGDHFLV